MALHLQTGTTGENLAALFLHEKGFSVLQQNWRHSRWEVDIIAAKEGILHFIEVKTRRSAAFGHPEEAVSKQKIRNLMHAADEYLHQHPQWKKIQFDVLAITLLKGQPPEYFFIEDVYL